MNILDYESAIEQITFQAQYTIDAQKKLQECAVSAQLNDLLNVEPGAELVELVQQAAQKIYQFNLTNSHHCLDPFFIIEKYSRYAQAIGRNTDDLTSFIQRFAKRIVRTKKEDLIQYTTQRLARLMILQTEAETRIP